MMAKGHIRLLFLILITGFASCSEAPVPAAANKITGTVDGSAFTLSNLLVFRESGDLFRISGRIDSDVLFTLNFVNSEVELHAVQTEGALAEFIETIDSLSNLDPATADTIDLDSLESGFEELLATDPDILGEDRCILFYIVNGVIFYSDAGEFRLTSIDESLGRISGTLEIRLRNFLGGTKELIGSIEDLQYVER